MYTLLGCLLFQNGRRTCHTIGIGCDKIKTLARWCAGDARSWVSIYVMGPFAIRFESERNGEGRRRLEETSSLWQCLYFMYGFFISSNSTIWLSLKRKSFSMHSIFEWICWIVPSPIPLSAHPLASVRVYGSPKFYFFCSFNLSLVYKWIVFSFWQSGWTRMMMRYEITRPGAVRRSCDGVQPPHSEAESLRDLQLAGKNFWNFKVPIFFSPSQSVLTLEAATHIVLSGRNLIKHL